MKTIAKITLSLTIFLMTLFNTNISLAANLEGSGTITFGKKSSSTCSGFGFCRMASDKTTTPKCEMNCMFKYDDVQRTFTIAISQTEITMKNPNLMQYFREKTSVTIEEDFLIPEEIRTLLSLTGNNVIKAGNYNLALKDGVYEIVITI